MKTIWIRRDRDTGEESEISFDDAKRKLSGYYLPVVAAMEAASRNNCLTTGFAYYYPKENS